MKIKVKVGIPIFMLLLFMHFIQFNHSSKNEYGNERIKKRKRDVPGEENNPCYMCKDAMSENIYTYDEIKQICQKCWEMYSVINLNDRVIITDGEYKNQIGVIEEIYEKTGYENKKIASVRMQDSENFIYLNIETMEKLIPEIIPDEKLCTLCYYFLYGEKKNCTKPICGLMCENCCRSNTYSCPFCRSIYKDVAIKFPITDMELEKLCEIHTFDPIPTDKTHRIMYGVIQNVQCINEKEILYDVQISDDYNWPKDEEERIIPDSKLNLGKKTAFIQSDGKNPEFKIFRPPPPRHQYTQHNNGRSALIDYLMSTNRGNFGFALQRLYRLRGVNIGEEQSELRRRQGRAELRQLRQRLRQAERQLRQLTQRLINRRYMNQYQIGHSGSPNVDLMSQIGLVQEADDTVIDKDNDSDRDTVIELSYESQIDVLNSQLDDSQFFRPHNS